MLINIQVHRNACQHVCVIHVLINMTVQLSVKDCEADSKDVWITYLPDWWRENWSCIKSVIHRRNRSGAKYFLVSISIVFSPLGFGFILLQMYETHMQSHLSCKDEFMIVHLYVLESSLIIKMCKSLRNTNRSFKPHQISLYFWWGIFLVPWFKENVIF